MIRDSGVWMMKKSVLERSVSPTCECMCRKMSQISSFLSVHQPALPSGKRVRMFLSTLWQLELLMLTFFSRFFWPAESTFGMKKNELLAKVQ